MIILQLIGLIFAIFIAYLIFVGILLLITRGFPLFFKITFPTKTEEEKKIIKENKRIQKEISDLEYEYNGLYSKPNFEKDKVLEFAKKNNITDLGIAASIFYKDEINKRKAEIKDLLKFFAFILICLAIYILVLSCYQFLKK